MVNKKVCIIWLWLNILMFNGIASYSNEKLNYILVDITFIYVSSWQRQHISNVLLIWYAVGTCTIDNQGIKTVYLEGKKQYSSVYELSKKENGTWLVNEAVNIYTPQRKKEYM
jgi:hypothetical protein